MCHISSSGTANQPTTAKPPDSKRVFLLGPSHHVYGRRCWISPTAEYETPLGECLRRWGWDGMGWDEKWDGMGWDGMEWDGMGRRVMGWDGKGWDRIGWDGMGDGMAWGWDGDGMGWNGMGWDGMGRAGLERSVIKRKCTRATQSQEHTPIRLERTLIRRWNPAPP